MSAPVGDVPRPCRHNAARSLPGPRLPVGGSSGGDHSRRTQIAFADCVRREPCTRWGFTRVLQMGGVEGFSRVALCCARSMQPVHHLSGRIHFCCAMCRCDLDVHDDSGIQIDQVVGGVGVMAWPASVPRARLTSAWMTLASAVKPWPPANPHGTHRCNTVSNTWRKVSLSRNRAWRLLENLERSGILSSRSSLQNQRCARFNCTSSHR